MPAFLRAIYSADGSRKAGAFALFLAATAIVAATGGIAWPAWVGEAKWALGLYLGAQGLSDAAGRIGKPKP